MDSDFFPLNTFTALELDIFDNFWGLSKRLEIQATYLWAKE